MYYRYSGATKHCDSALVRAHSAQSNPTVESPRNDAIMFCYNRHIKLGRY